MRLHDLRHTVGTYAGQSGANAFLIRDLLRHGDLAITDRYVSRDDGPLRTLSEMPSDRIAAGLAGKSSAEATAAAEGIILSTGSAGGAPFYKRRQIR